LVAPSPPLLENSISLPGEIKRPKRTPQASTQAYYSNGFLNNMKIAFTGSPIHGKPGMGLQLALRRGHDIEVPPEAIKNLMPALDRLVKEQRVSFEIANKIISTHVVPMDLAPLLGLAAHASSRTRCPWWRPPVALCHWWRPIIGESIGWSTRSCPPSRRVVSLEFSLLGHPGVKQSVQTIK